MKKNLIIILLTIIIIMFFIMLFLNKGDNNIKNEATNNTNMENLNVEIDNQNKTNNESVNDVVDEKTNQTVNETESNTVKEETEKENETSKENLAQTKVSFSNKSLFAIGYVTDNNEEQFIKKYFYNKTDYNSLPTVNLGDVNKFVIIPKNEDTQIKVWTCSLSEEGKLKKDKLIFTNKLGALIVKTGEVEFVANVIIEVNYNGKSISCPIQFSGLDGHLTFTENKDNIMDISIY